VVAEDGSESASQLWETRHPAASSFLAYPEGRAALAAAQRGGRLTAADHAKAVEDFEAIQDELVLVAVDVALSRAAGDLAEQLGLRGYDAVHLASALTLGEPTTVVTWGEELRRAAADSGCAIAPAE
jgi:predicted nucleic acid-binding protein